jgi:C1A family cysteine protease
LLAFLVAVQCSQLSNEFAKWKQEHNKQYHSEEEESQRYKIWQSNREFVLSDPEHLEMNMFSDLSAEEFGRAYFMSAVDVPPEEVVPFNATEEDLLMMKRQQLPESFNWNDKGMVTPAVSQGNCGSCAAFAATAAIESAYAIKTNNLVKLSEQSILDCVERECVETNPVCTTRRGCCGNHMQDLFQLARDKYIIYDKTYDKYAFDGLCVVRPMCPRDAKQSRVRVAAHWRLPSSESSIMTATLEQPIAFAIYFDDRVTPYLQQYRAGTVFAPPANTMTFNRRTDGHAMLITGWGTGAEGDFWHVKNSWGPFWGDKGFMKYGRFRNNLLDIANHAWRVTTE